MPAGTLLYAQSGGVTAVINATASAVLQTARARKVRVLAARNGILGALREALIDTTAMPLTAVKALAHTPAPGAADWASARAAYLARFPDVTPMTELPDFRFITLQITGARKVAGFGAARSVPADELASILAA